MGRPYSDDLRSRVVALMESGGDCRSVGKMFGIAPSTAGNWHRRYRQTRSYAARPMGGDQRSKLIIHAERIGGLLAETSDLTLADVRAVLAREGVQVAYSTVRHSVRKLGLRFKKNDICE